MTTKSPHWPYTTLTATRRREILQEWIAAYGHAKRGTRLAEQVERYKEELNNAHLPPLPTEQAS